MDWMMLVNTVLVQVVIPALAALLAGYLVRWLRVRGIVVEEEGARIQLQSVMEAVVRWAEQRWGPDAGDEKYVAAMNMLEDIGYDATDPMVQAELEAAVNRLSPEWDGEQMVLFD